MATKPAGNPIVEDLTMRSLCSLVAITATIALAPAQDGTFVKSGTGCPQFTFSTSGAPYQVLEIDNWNLDGRCYSFVPDGLGGWLVTEDGAWIAPSSGAQTVGPADDAVQGPFNLGFTFTYPGGAGSTTAIDVAPNGYIYLEAGTNFATRCCNAAAGLTDFLNATPSVAVLGTDLDVTAAGTCVFESTTVSLPSGQTQNVATVTWTDVPEWVRNGKNTVQGQLWDDGTVVICHQRTSQFRTLDTALVGVSVGGGVAPAGQVELNPSVGLRIDTFPNIDTTVTVTADHVPATASLVELEIGLAQVDIALDAAIMAPAGCNLLVSPIIFGGGMTIAAPEASITFPIANDVSAIGQVFELQAIVVDLTLPDPAPLLASDRATFTIGQLSNNDDCIGAFPITAGVTAGDTLTATDSTPLGSCTNMGRDVWYQYVAPCDGSVTFSFCSVNASATYDTVLAAWTGTCDALTPIACNDDTCSTQSEISFPIVAGTVYYVSVGGWVSAITGPRQGEFVLEVVENCL